jgi:PhnB protein
MLKRDDGTVRHSEIRIGDSPVMLVDADENFPSINPEHTPIHLHLYVEDIDAFTHQAVEAGATLIMQPEDKDDGERRGGIQDPFGFTWWIATQIKAISREELQKQYDSR